MKTLVPKDYHIPLKLEKKSFFLRPLSVQDNEKDYIAVTNSMAYRGGVDKKVKNLTKQKNLENLKRHEREFKSRKAFTYTVMKLDEASCLGCVYINPPTRGNYDAEVWIWVTKEAYDKGFNSELYRTIKIWLEEDWPFKRVAYPGREISWDTWDSLRMK